VLTAWNSSPVLFVHDDLADDRAPHATVKQIAEREDESAAAVVTINRRQRCFDCRHRARTGGHQTTAAARTGPALPVYRNHPDRSWCWWAYLAVHYAHSTTRRGDGAPLQFPHEEHNPDYWDFLYFIYHRRGGADLRRYRHRASHAQAVLGAIGNELLFQRRGNRPVDHIAAGLIVPPERKAVMKLRALLALLLSLAACGLAQGQPAGKPLRSSFPFRRATRWTHVAPDSAQS